MNSNSNYNKANKRPHRKHPNKRRPRPNNPNGNSHNSNGNRAESSKKFSENDGQNQTLPQSVQITSSDLSAASQEAMDKLNIHDKEMLGHEIIEKGKRNFLGFLGPREVTYQFFILHKAESMAHTFLEKLIELGQLDLSYRASESGNQLKVDFVGEDEDLMKKNYFELLNSIENLTRKHLIKKAGIRGNYKLSFTVNGESNSKEFRLESLAKKMREKVLTNNKPTVLNSMPPGDRRIIHQFLSDDPEVNTTSLGDGYYKKIQISPSSVEK